MRGRPTRSEIRQNIINILYVVGEAYGYEIYKTYISLFGRCSMKSIYYHLKKGVSLGEFIVSKIEKEKGDFSWGSEAEKKYYKLGPNAKPEIKKDLKEKIEKFIRK